VKALIDTSHALDEKEKGKNGY